MSSADSRRSNSAIQLSVCVVTPLADARVAPTQPAAYRRRYAPRTPELDPYLHNNYTSQVEELRFAWDPRKASANLRKHRVSFTEAETVFSDDNAILLDDPGHS